MPFKPGELQRDELAEEPEQQKSEKEAVWREKEQEVEQIPNIERGAVEIVTALNILGVETSQSCEGHVDADGGDARIIRPFVEVSAQNQPEKRFLGQEKLLPKLAKKYGLSQEDARTMLLHSAPWEEFQNSKEAKDYQKWRKENKKIAEKARELLEGFNQDETSENVRLIISEQNSGQFEITNAGQGAELPQYQSQMDNFTEFLKQKYLNE